MAHLPTHDSQEQFISDNVEHLARAAYAGYRDIGRGVLVILPEGKDSSLGNLSILQYHYMTTDELIDAITASRDNPPVARAVKRDIRSHVEGYNPSTSIVVTFFRRSTDPGDLKLYQVECPTPPAAAYAAFVN